MVTYLLCLFDRGPPRFGEDRPRFGDRDGYRGGPRGAMGDFGGEKGSAPADFQPSFRVSSRKLRASHIFFCLHWFLNSQMSSSFQENKLIFCTTCPALLLPLSSKLLDVFFLDSWFLLRTWIYSMSSYIIKGMHLEMSKCLII
jgi:hypothetical protein